MKTPTADLILAIAEAWRAFAKSELQAGRIYDPDEACVAIAGEIESRYRLTPIEDNQQETT